MRLLEDAFLLLLKKFHLSGSLLVCKNWMSIQEGTRENMEFVMTDYNEGTKFDGEDYSIGDI